MSVRVRLEGDPVLTQAAYEAADELMDPSWGEGHYLVCGVDNRADIGVDGLEPNAVLRLPPEFLPAPTAWAVVDGGDCVWSMGTGV